MESRRERRKLYGAGLHTKKKLVHVHVSKELRATVKKRAVQVAKGDKVKVLRGDNKGKTAKVARVSIAYGKIYLEGQNSRTAKGREIPLAFEPSNLVIVELSGRSKEERAKLAKESKAAASKEKDEPKAPEKKTEAGTAVGGSREAPKEERSKEDKALEKALEKGELMKTE